MLKAISMKYTNYRLPEEKQRLNLIKQFSFSVISMTPIFKSHKLLALSMKNTNYVINQGPV